MDWCKLVQSIESTLDIRDSLVVLKNRAEALAAADNAGIERTGGHQDFLLRLIGNRVDTGKLCSTLANVKRDTEKPPNNYPCVPPKR